MARPAELGGLRQRITANDYPVLLDADEVVAGDTNRHLIRSVEVRAALLAMRAPYRPAPRATATTCKSCGGALPLGARRGTRFCGKRCADMSPSQRARLRQIEPSANPAETLAIETAAGAISGAAMGLDALAGTRVAPPAFTRPSAPVAFDVIGD